MSGKPKACIFCGATPLSKEHVWSEWTYQILPKRQGTTHARGVIQSSRASQNIKGLRYLKHFQGDVSGIQIRVVCRSPDGGLNSLGNVGCNNGWMSDQETRVKPILSPLILGQPIVMGRDQQRILASWVATKIMVAEHADAEVVSTKSDMAYVMNYLRPPDTWKIWIARQTGRRWRTGYQRNSATLGTLDETGTPVPANGSFAKNTQLATLGIGYLVIQVFSTREPAIASYGYKNKVALFRIHPFDGDFLWPPRTILSDANIDYLGAQYERWLSTLKWRASS